MITAPSLHARTCVDTTFVVSPSAYEASVAGLTLMPARVAAEQPTPVGPGPVGIEGEDLAVPGLRTQRLTLLYSLGISAVAEAVVAPRACVQYEGSSRGIRTW